MHKVSPYGNIEGLWTIIDSMGVSLSKHMELVMDKEAWRAAIHGVAKSWTRLSDWTELNWTIIILSKGIQNSL